MTAYPTGRSSPTRRTGPRFPTRAPTLLAASTLALLPLLPVEGATGGILDPTSLSAQATPEADPVVLTVDEALRTALDQNREIRLARAALSEAEGQVSEAWGNVYPRIELTGSYRRNISPPASFFPAIFFDPDAGPDELVRVQFGAENVWSNSITLEQPIFEAQAFIGVGAAGRFRALQEETLRGATHGIVTRVRVLFYDLLLVQEQAGLLERSVERVMESLEETRALNRAGLTSDYDVLRLEVELANLQPQLRRAMNEARRKEREMVTELDLPEGTRLQVAGELARMNLDDPADNLPANRALLQTMGVELVDSADPARLAQLFERARVMSSTIQQSGLREELAHTEMRLEQAEYLPRVALFGDYQIQAQQDGSPDFFGQSGQRGYGRFVGIRVTVPLFTGFQRNARVQQKRAALDGARLEREVAEARLRDELRSLLEEIEEARDRARGQGLAVQQAQRGYEIASAEYREGTGSQLELTDAEVALRQSEFNYAEAVFEYLSSRARLDELVGDVPTDLLR